MLHNRNSLSMGRYDNYIYDHYKNNNYSNKSINDNYNKTPSKETDKITTNGSSKN